MTQTCNSHLLLSSFKSYLCLAVITNYSLRTIFQSVPMLSFELCFLDLLLKDHSTKILTKAKSTLFASPDQNPKFDHDSRPLLLILQTSFNLPINPDFFFFCYGAYRCSGSEGPRVCKCAHSAAPTEWHCSLCEQLRDVLSTAEQVTCWRKWKYACKGNQMN